MGREPHTHLNIEQRGGVTMHTNKSPGAAATASGAETNFCTSLGTSNPFSQQGLVASAHARMTAAYGALPTLFEETFARAPLGLKERLYRHITPTMAGACLVDLARVRFESHRFDFDQGGQWAIVLPDYENGMLTDFAAFCVEQPALRRPYTCTYAVQFESALRDAHYHPQRRMLLHVDVWSFLQAECVGCLPLSWKGTALRLLANDICEVVVSNETQAAQVKSRLEEALRIPAIFVIKPRGACHDLD